MTAGRRSVTYLSLLVAAAATLAVPGSVPGARAAACVPSGRESGINAALAGTGATAVLCPGAVFTLTSPITFTAPNQVIETQGLPTGTSRAIRLPAPRCGTTRSSPVPRPCSAASTSSTTRP